MLESISIKNIALIDQAFIELSEGLNVLTGETGAGKSIIIDSLGFAIGEKTSREIIRAGEKSGRVEVVFSISEELAQQFCQEHGIEAEDETLIISRTINDSGKTTTRINGQAVTAQALRKITGELIDIHGQHEHQSLLDISKQAEFVDGFCGEVLSVKKSALAEKYGRYIEVKSRIKDIQAKQADKESRLEFLEYRIGELESAGLKNGEEELLLEEKKAVLSADKLMDAIETAIEAIYDGGNNGEKSALDSVDEGASAIDGAAYYDKRLEPFAERLYAVKEEIKDVSIELSRYRDGIDATPGRIDEIEERLNEIYIAKRKYGGSVLAALESYEKMLEERDGLQSAEFELGKLSKELEESLADVNTLCGEITDIRKKAAAKMEKLITSALKDLSMENAAFKIVFSEAQISAEGADKIELFLSANKGEAVKPLAKIASGGEMSRVMLAVKSIAASQGTIGTFIFDEIDQGTSGRTAQKVAEKMAVIAGEKQIICITHLPQIAAIADKHILIEKTTIGGKTVSNARELDENQITTELSRLLGGAKITEQTVRAAAEMRQLAKQLKIKNNSP